MSATSDPAARLPRQVPYIIANEGCERFSFYGMRNILTTFLPMAFYASLPKAMGEQAAKDVFHTFVAGVYFFPLLGGWLSDRWFGKYRTIFWMSLIYCGGHALLAVSEDSKQGFFFGLGLIALGSGGIKPLVSSFVGDQFDQHNKHLAKAVFDAFYWIINFGSFFASLFMPKLLAGWGPASWWGISPASVAFGIPGVFMFLATFALWLARDRYVHVPPTPPDPNSFTRILRTAILSPTGNPVGRFLAFGGVALGVASVSLIWLTPSLGIVTPLCIALGLILVGICWGAWMRLGEARSHHPREAVDGAAQVLRILVLFALVSPFWSLFDQKASTFVFQGKQMAWPSWVGPPEMQALNPALVMLFVPFNRTVLYPALARRGIDWTPLQRMGTGIALAGIAFLIAAALQFVIDGGARLSLYWQIIPYAFLTMGEVLLSATGLEFAYSQAPKAMKGVLMAFWSLAVTFGNLWVLLFDKTIKTKSIVKPINEAGLSTPAFLMIFFGTFALLAALAFAAVARRYRMVDNYRAS